MTDTENLSEFELYLQEVQRRAHKSLSEIEKGGTEAALDRCRELASQVRSRLHSMSEHAVGIHSLADFQVSLERACTVLAQKGVYSPPRESCQDEP